MTNNKSVFHTYLIYFIVMALFTLVRTFAALGMFSFLPTDAASAVFTIIIQVVLMFLVPLFLFKFFGRKQGATVKSVFEKTNLKRVRPNVVMASVALGVVAFFINIIVSSFFNNFISFFGFEFPTGSQDSALGPVWSFLLNVVLVAVLPAIFEELLHRGWLLSELGKVGYKKAILITSVLFGLIHFNITQVSYAFVIGIILAIVTLASKSVVPAIIIHFTNNFTSVYLSSAKANGWFLHDFYSKLNSILISDSFLLSIFTMIMFAVVLLFFVYYFVFYIFKETTVYGVNKAIKTVMTSKAQGLNLTTDEEKNIILNDMIKNRSNINLGLGNPKNTFDLVLPVNKAVFKTTSFDNAFLIASYVLGGLVTIFTFIWGVI